MIQLFLIFWQQILVCQKDLFSDFTFFDLCVIDMANILLDRYHNLQELENKRPQKIFPWSIKRVACHTTMITQYEFSL